MHSTPAVWIKRPAMLLSIGGVVCAFFLGIWWMVAHSLLILDSQTLVTAFLIGAAAATAFYLFRLLFSQWVQIFPAMIGNDPEVQALYRDFLHILDNTSDYIFMHDRNHGIHFCSKAVAALAGCETWQELVGKSWYDVFSAGTVPQRRSEDAQIFENGQTFLGLVTPYTNKDGDSGWVETSKWPVYDPTTRTVIGIFGISRDVTLRKRIEDRVRIRTQFVELLLKQASIHNVLSIVVDYVEVSAPDIVCCILLADDRKEFLHLEAAPHIEEAIKDVMATLPIAEDFSVCSRAAKNGQRVIVSDIASDPLCSQRFREPVLAAGFVSVWSEPIIVGGNTLLGTLGLYNRTAHTPTPNMIALVEEAARLAGDALLHKQNEQTIWRQANYDSLTGLPNRRLFADRLEHEARRSLRNGQPIALLMIDLDRFKAVNDTLGHSAGDTFLIEVSRRMQGCIRESDTVARLGGDEFAIILPNLLNADVAGTVMRSLIEAIEKPVSIGTHSVEVSCSIGVGVYRGDGATIEDVMKQADQAMYERKRENHLKTTRKPRRVSKPQAVFSYHR